MRSKESRAHVIRPLPFPKTDVVDSNLAPQRLFSSLVSDTVATPSLHRSIRLASYA
jgi:hypothetical protein